MRTLAAFTGTEGTGNIDGADIAVGPIQMAADPVHIPAVPAYIPAVATVKSSKDMDDENVTGQFVKKLICNFDEDVLNFLDKSARDAIIQQKSFTDEKEFKRIKLAIEARILYLLNQESQLTKLPSVGFFRQVCGVLANRYPYMFLEDPKVTVDGITFRQFIGKGTGGVTGISSLPKALQQKFAKMLDQKHGVIKQKKRRDLPDGNSAHTAPKKKRKVYGVHSDKYYVSGTEGQMNFLGMLDSLESAEEREELYSENREDVQNILSSSTDMFSAVPGFFNTLTHAENHFQWLTGKNIAQTIEAEVPRQFRLMKSVVQTMCATREFRLNLEIAKIKGGEQNGSIVPEFVCLLRQLTVEWHKNPGGLLRFPSEPESDSPHILCPEGVGSIKFDLHVEKKKIFADLNFSEALRAFFSVSFIGNLEYPEQAEAVAILLQRKVAGINAEGMDNFYWIFGHCLAGTNIANEVGGAVH